MYHNILQFFKLLKLKVAENERIGSLLFNFVYRSISTLFFLIFNRNHSVCNQSF